MNDSHQQPRLDRVQVADEIEEVAALATEIWNEHFPSIIGQAQVDYMLQEFQSVDAIHRQIGQQRYEYFLVGHPGSRAGYFAIVPLEEERSMQLSKLYLRRSARRRGLGGRIVEWLERQCRLRGLDKLWLTVNKDNRASIDFYERAGFKTESASVFDIGDGFIMDDYVMTKPIVVDEP